MPYRFWLLVLSIASLSNGCALPDGEACRAEYLMNVIGEGNMYLAVGAVSRFHYDTPACSVPQELDPGTQDRASAGISDARFEVGNYHRMRANYAAAAHWLCLAANQGHAQAQWWMGVFYLEGKMASGRDPVRSYKWLGLAEWSGEPSAANLKAAVAKDLSPDQREAAERLVKNWDPDPASCPNIDA